MPANQPNPASSAVEKPNSVGAFLREHRVMMLTLMVLAALVWIAGVHIDATSQLITASALLIGMLTLSKLQVKGIARIILMFIGVFLSARYFIWRTEHTLIFDDPVTAIASVGLYVAEGYGILVYMLGVFVNLRPLNREAVPLPEDKAEWPTVDVFIPTYNEPGELIETTLMAAIQIDYPADKISVHLMDDGGTDQKCNDTNIEKATEARERRRDLKKMAERLGVTYHTRAKNEHAKAGNMNSAFQNTDGELILILDTDHVPSHDILQHTAGWFVRDEKMFLVQTPHFFINSDPIEKNLDTFHQMPSENEMFYSVIQKGLDFWNAAFFCGSAAVLRRKCLAEVGGIAGETITEDAETAVTLHAKGYKSAYIQRPLIAGLSPETMGGFVVQRIRWAQGMAQIFLLKNPLSIKGLKLSQRLCYFNSCFFWFFGYARLVFILAPLLFLFFGMQIYDANLIEFVAFALPHVIAAIMISDFLYGKVRWAFVSELYELIQCVYTFPALVRVLLKPRAPSFNVTPKGEHLDEDFVSPMGKPFYALTALTLAGIGAGVWRFFEFPDQRHVVVITVFWTLFNLVLLLAAVGVLFERRQRRAFPRMPADWAVRLKSAAGNLFDGAMHDLSVGGLSLDVSEEDARAFSDGETVRMKIEHGTVDQRKTVFHMQVRKMFPIKERGQVRLGLAFAHTSNKEAMAKVSYVYGDSQRWVDFQKSRARSIGVHSGLLVLTCLGAKRVAEYLRHLANLGVSAIAAKLKPSRDSVDTAVMEVKPVVAQVMPLELEDISAERKSRATRSGIRIHREEKPQDKLPKNPFWAKPPERDVITALRSAIEAMSPDERRTEIESGLSEADLDQTIFPDPKPL